MERRHPSGPKGTARRQPRLPHSRHYETSPATARLALIVLGGRIEAKANKLCLPFLRVSAYNPTRLEIHTQAMPWLERGPRNPLVYCRIGETMKTAIACLLACLLLSVPLCVAQAPAGATAGATGLCNDGTYYTGTTKQGACKGHKGVKDWYGTPVASAAKTPAASPSSTPAPAGTPVAPATKTPAASTPAPASAPAAKAPAHQVAQAPGGGADKVWLNTASNIYHCPGSRYYGKTKTGAYMSEAEAKSKGAHPDRGQACK